MSSERAALPDHHEAALRGLLGQPLTIPWTKVREADGSPRLTAHRLAFQRDIRLRAFEISQSRVSRTPVENWRRVENDLLARPEHDVLDARDQELLGQRIWLFLRLGDPKPWPQYGRCVITMAEESVSTKSTQAEAAVRALYNFLSNYYLGSHHAWMHDFMPSDDYERGEAAALTGLVLIPELRAAFDALERELGRSGGQLSVSNLETWHQKFKREDKPSS